jgi:hypothetical protein
MSTDQPAVPSSEAGEHTRFGDHPIRAVTRAAYRDEAAGELVAMSFPGVRRIAGWLFWVVFPMLCLGALALAVLGIAHHVGNHPAGTRGTYIADRSCARGICLVGGTFVSDDGALRVTSLLGDPRWPDGSQHTVFYDGSSVEVIGVAKWDPTPSVLAGIGAGTFLGVLGYCFRVTRREQQH